MDSPKPLSYRSAGVNIDAGNALVDRIKPLARSTQRPGVLGGLGGFGGLFELPGGYREPVLVSGTDGVGTKLLLALEAQQHDGIGIDLVAMCVNDILVSGAEPLWFLDYYACGQLDTQIAETVIAGIAEGCRQAGCALLGGETAEMPGMYPDGHYDLAGFAVGIVEKSEILSSAVCQEGDALIGMASSGAHSNGYSLIREILVRSGAHAHIQLQGEGLVDLLLRPTRIYVRAIQNLRQVVPVHALAHITGGGLTENLPRSLPAHLSAHIDPKSWLIPALFGWLQEQGQVTTEEMRRVFNLGIGMVAIVPWESRQSALESLAASGEQGFIIGQLAPRQKDTGVVYLD
ncbi:phosphoribosylformylglycinamidine cyclo-ligase [Acidithiobacillus marinus]|uniref:Phosphoribosylformylglycinamidine cyclo-ligase n=1 Tax=Acidithiobacillus marinus TaxID=187490 RepID=A0A2I1DMQ4_9PROT|nr:phosphoribosylformylglycinamidine cyclo-ligase [Acidithiobacillus marinus]PKY11144.1 phosphoribosylformylglycinamidine cyclo-ligase [Acidithiobacillus marinus]